ncbi:hypothetical protein CCO03_10570 [Comamonas serinivorans]|uniref:Outer membrane protein assembly factor BamC n=1 Tax=Comamonas serinivorans TaxID=1082851 RepID=A0A1Y0ETW1_9BURK|nr:hypothetical protein CCO03_10570 [Comamonas serinivorans]
MTWTATAACLALSACSVLETDKIDYKSAGKGVSLEVPPDLTQLAAANRYQMPGGNVTASGYESAQRAQAASPNTTAAMAVGDVRMERLGGERWLVIDRPADKLWQPVRDFWQENGFLLAVDEPRIGIMETDWAENRAKLPQDIIRSTIGKVFDQLYSTGERDKFRTRMESSNGKTEVFITHRGMVEEYTSQTKDSTQWQPRPADHELEAEFLRRLMVKLGVSEEQSKAVVAAGGVQPAARVAEQNGTPVVQVDDDFDRAWRRVGLALDRTGFTVEDRDRSQGIYFVRYLPPDPNRKEAGFFGRLFGSTPKAAEALKYQVRVTSTGGQSVVRVLKGDGTPESSDNARRIAQLLADDLK